ncbi:hypothetical protein H0H81_005319 [Sphagnurus paluster]|uniref:Uncharacterized protein n=1 Tax=Sphagnurus paluster TaxID=117069 RepID=A0A9P7FXU4_9AGAR|nr:hypothetical protein H0H81_005319 [Sphagnurus paluster]
MLSQCRLMIASLPVVILAPLGAVSLLWNALFARLILGDVFSPWMILGTILIAGGAVLIAFFGIVPEPTHSLEDLLLLFSRPAFIIYFSILGFIVIFCLIVAHITDFALSRKLSQIDISALASLSDSESTQAMALTAPSKPTPALTTDLTAPSEDNGIATERTPLIDPKPTPPSSSLYGRTNDAELKYINRTRLLLAISYASFSGILSGMCLLFAKSGVELLLLTIGGQNQFWRWQAWVLVFGLVAFALLQLWYLHKALILADPTLVCPSAFCFYNLSSIVNGLVYFDQFSLIPPLHLGMVVLGLLVLLGGVWVVSIQSGAKEADGETWSEELNADIETSALDNNERQAALDRISQRGVEAVPLERGIESEPNIHDRASCSYTTDDPSLSHSTTRLRLHRRMPSVDISGHAAHPSVSPPLLPMSMGAGFQIGLSPVSPGFAIVPRERGRRVSGLGFAHVVEEAMMSAEEQERRRTTSEGDMRRRAAALRENGEAEGPGRIYNAIA